MRRRAKATIPAAAAAFSAVIVTVACGQVQVNWATGVSGSFLDAARWSGPVPQSAAYDAYIGATKVSNAYIVSTLVDQPVTTGKLTVANADASAGFTSLNVVRGVQVDAGSFTALSLTAPFLATTGSGYAE